MMLVLVMPSRASIRASTATMVEPLSVVTGIVSGLSPALTRAL
jgi:hypothetical protein